MLQQGVAVHREYLFNLPLLGPEKTLLRFGHSCHKGRPLSALGNAVVERFNKELGPEEFVFFLALQTGIWSLRFHQGRYMIDTERGTNSEHPAHHFHTLVCRALNVEPLTVARLAE